MDGKESKSREVGRPSKYNEELQAKADRYILDHEKQGDVIPSHAGLCCWLGIAKPTLYEWGKIHEAFSNTLANILVKQEVIAVNKGLKGEFNSTITKLVLANHGYAEKKEVQHKGGLNLTDVPLTDSQRRIIDKALDDDV